MPTGLVRAGATVMERLPRPLITRDDLTALEYTDQTCDITPAVETFGVRPVSLDEQLRRALCERRAPPVNEAGPARRGPRRHIASD
jgi:hypothetical protein